MVSPGPQGDPLLPAAPDLGLVVLEHHAVVTSTMDAAHARAAGSAPAGTLILADAQTDGRGRAGRRWNSGPGDGVWFTLIERPANASGLSVLSLRLGVALADALDPLANDVVRVKWPNDLYLRDAKLAGILVETRWRVGALDWVAIGVGINLRNPSQFAPVAMLRTNTSRSEVLRAVIPPLRKACRAVGALSAQERARWNARDLTIGRTISEPVAGIVRGLAEDGALCVETADGLLTPVRSGSIVFASPG